jgi:hypothetical protein
MRSKTMGMVLLCYRISVAFVGDDPELTCIWTTCDVGLKTMLLSLYWTWVVITYVNSDVCWTICEHVVTCDLYVKSCTILVVCWLVWDPSWYLSDYRVYMGSGVTVWPLRWPSLYLCSYKLDSSVTPPLPTRPLHPAAMRIGGRAPRCPRTLPPVVELLSLGGRAPAIASLDGAI